MAVEQRIEREAVVREEGERTQRVLDRVLLPPRPEQQHYRERHRRHRQQYPPQAPTTPPPPRLRPPPPTRGRRPACDSSLPERGQGQQHAEIAQEQQSADPPPERQS